MTSSRHGNVYCSGPSVKFQFVFVFCKIEESPSKLYMCFVDFKKAFDSISHNKLWGTMMDMEYPIHLIDLPNYTRNSSLRLK